MKTLLIAAVERELSIIVAHFTSQWDRGRAHFHCGEREFIAAVTGIGAVNTAARLAASLEREGSSVYRVWMMGSCGSYRPAIGVGDVVVATEEINGDLGIQRDTGWQSPEHFGFDIVKLIERSYVNRFPCALPHIEIDFFPGYRVFRGPMLTVSTVSGCRAAATVLSARFQALAENMEGAAAAQVAAMYGLPFIEIRGVSNTAGDRDQGRWDMDSACRNSQDLAIRLIESRVSIG